MNKLHAPQDHHSWDIDEPAFGEGPLQPFEVSYQVEGTQYTATVQAFFKEGEKQSSYRATYKNSEPQKVIDYALGVGFVEEGKGRTPHAVAIGKCIQERFSG